MEKSNNDKRSDFLATERTILANDRTLLAYIRTFLSFLGGGIACIKFLEQSYGFYILGIAFIMLSPILLAFGFYRYKKISTRIKKQDINE